MPVDGTGAAWKQDDCPGASPAVLRGHRITPPFADSQSVKGQMILNREIEEEGADDARKKLNKTCQNPACMDQGDRLRGLGPVEATWPWRQCQMYYPEDHEDDLSLLTSSYR